MGITNPNLTGYAAKEAISQIPGVSIMEQLSPLAGH